MNLAENFVNFAENSGRDTGYWTFVAWDNVFAPVLDKAFGVSVRAMDEKNVDDLLGATVIM